MVKATVIIKDVKGKVVFTKNWETKNPESAAEKFSHMWPDCWVTVSVKVGKVTIAKQPLNMAKDQLLVDSGKMSISKFMKKWYGKAPSAKAIKKELIEEFGEEDLVY